MVELMHRREAVFTVLTPPEEVWRFIRDIESLCACIPGVERVRVVDDTTAELTVVEKVGVVPIRVDFAARIDAESPPNSLHAVATAEHVDVEIDVRLRAVEQGTELAGSVQIAGRGPLKPVVDRLFERRATERTAQFAQLLEDRFGANPRAEAAKPTAEGWLRRFWRRLIGQFGYR